MAVKNSSVGALLKPSLVSDGSGCFMYVSCGSNSAQLYLDKLDESRRPLGKCILFKGSWFSPSDFESHCGKKTKKWRQAITHLGKPLGDYNLSCSQTQRAKHASHVADTHSRFQGHSPHVGSQGPSRSVSPALPSASSHIHSKPVLINSVLSFIKAYRLKGDVESLKKRVCQHFSPADVENAKKELWDYCRKDLEAAGIAYHIRRGSDKRSQLAANVDDLAEAFVALDSSDLIPGIYCEATDLLRIPSLSLDPVSEKVETNTLSLNDLVAKVGCLEAKIASLVGVCSKASSYSSYAAATSSNATVPLSSSPVARNLSAKSPPSGDRECNLILFGLPEGRSIVDTKDSVDEILEFLAGKPIPVKDVFRLGRYDRTSSGSQSSRRPRPVLVKLTTQWDRKLILLRKSNLRSFKISCLFLREDVPPDHKLRTKVHSKVATQSSSDEAHRVSSVSTASTHGNKSQTSVTVAYNPNQESEVTGDHPSSRTSLASLHHIIPELSRSSSPVDLSSSTSSSSTVVQGNSLTS